MNRYRRWSAILDLALLAFNALVGCWPGVAIFGAWLFYDLVTGAVEVLKPEPQPGVRVEYGNGPSESQSGLPGA